MSPDRWRSAEKRVHHAAVSVHPGYCRSSSNLDCRRSVASRSVARPERSRRGSKPDLWKAAASEGLAVPCRRRRWRALERCPLDYTSSGETVDYSTSGKTGGCVAIRRSYAIERRSACLSAADVDPRARGASGTEIRVCAAARASSKEPASILPGKRRRHRKSRRAARQAARTAFGIRARTPRLPARAKGRRHAAAFERGETTAAT